MMNPLLDVECISFLKKWDPPMRSFVIVALMMALLPASAHAQQRKGPLTNRTDEQMKQDAEIDKAYQDVLKNSKNNGQPAKIDPWQTIRPAAADGTKR
jgi:hypothetical protein